MALTKEEKIDMFSMVLDGKTYEEIGQKYGISRQRVQQLLTTNSRSHRAVNTIIYTGLKKWLIEQDMSVAKLQSLMGFESKNVARTYIKLRNKGIIKISDIKKILEITGLTFEECFGEEEL